MNWDYRLVRHQFKVPKGRTYVEYGIHEAYYNKIGECVALTMNPVEVCGSSLKEARYIYNTLGKAFKLPILDYAIRKPIPVQKGTPRGKKRTL